MEQSNEIKELATALAIAQSKIKGAIKDSSNPFFKSSYADLSSVWDACREALTTNGLSIIQGCSDEADKIIVTTQIMHSSGQWIRDKLSAKPVKQDPQSIGSCITYLRRYALAAIAGVCPEDDDGNAATGKVKDEFIIDSQVKLIKALIAKFTEGQYESFSTKYPKVEEIKKSEFDTVVARINKTIGGIS